MAARTTQKTGLASDSTVWDGGTPLADGDSITIAAGHVLTWDMDKSAWAVGVAGITIPGHASTTPGQLTFSTSPGTYVLPIKDATTIGGTNLANKGRLWIGSQGTPYPTTCLAKILFLGTATAANITLAYLDVQIWAAEPATRWCRLTASASGTTLTIDADVRGDWAAGDTVAVCQWQSGSSTNELYTIQSVDSATQITLTGTVNPAKAIGSAVLKINRPVELWSATTSGSSYSVVNGGGTVVGNVFQCAMRHTGTTNQTARSGSAYVNQIRAIIRGSIYGFNNGIDVNYGCTLDAVVVNCGNGILYSSGGVRWCSIAGVIAGCNNAVASSYANVVQASAVVVCNNQGTSMSGQFGGKLIGNAVAVFGTQIVVEFMRTAKIGGAGVDANGQDIGYSLATRGYGVSLGSTNQVASGAYQFPCDSPYPYHFFYDVADGNGTAQPGRLAYWGNGGYGKSEDWVLGTHGTPPVPLAFVHKANFGNNVGKMYIDIPLWVDAGRPIRAAVYLCKQQNGMVATPRAELIDPTVPWGGAGEVLAGATMADDLTWQTIRLQYANASASPQRLALRVWGINGSGSLYWAYQVHAGAGCPRPLSLGV